MCYKRSIFVLTMKKYGLQSAEYIKCLFIDYLLLKSKELIIEKILGKIQILWVQRNPSI